MKYFLIYIILSWIASGILVFIPNRYTKTILTLVVVINPFVIFLIGIEAILKRKRKAKKELE